MSHTVVKYIGQRIEVTTGSQKTVFRDIPCAATQIASLHEEIERQWAESERLRERLSAQCQQTQNTAQQKHDAVLEAINRHGGVPEGIDPQGHPIEQIVGTVLAVRDAEIDRLRAERDEAIEYAKNLCNIGDWLSVLIAMTERANEQPVCEPMRRQ